MSLLKSIAAEAVALVISVGIHALPTLDQRNEKMKFMESSISKQAIDRKRRSEVVLRSEGVPISPNLPVIESEGNLKRRSTDEVAFRALALLTVAVKGEGLEQPIVDRIVKDYALETHFSPAERAFILNPNPTQHERIQFAWRYEAAWVMLWSLGYVESLGKPDGICDVPRAVEFMHKRSAKQFIADARPRELSAILEQADLIYRYHWAVVDARIKGEEFPAGLEPGVTLERHYAFNWLIGCMDQEWDDVSTDT